ncbi:MAG TPA: hypothetical protein PLS03_06800 [Terrimicrobiaceae bacterium]|nr:hypothetical protein [Terrimicrobiaceae bacterium]
MKTLTFKVTDEEHERLAAIADVLGGKLVDFLSEEAIPMLLEYLDGNVGEMLAARIYDSLEDAKDSAAKADALDGIENEWRFYLRPGGSISAECSEGFHEDRIAQGCVLIEEQPA